MDNALECDEFFKTFKGIVVSDYLFIVTFDVEGEVWICKPNTANQVSMVTNSNL